MILGAFRRTQHENPYVVNLLVYGILRRSEIVVVDRELQYRAAHQLGPIPDRLP